MPTLAALTAKFDAVWPLLDERTRRLTAANEAKALGYGGITLVHRACGLSRRVIATGIEERDRRRREARAHSTPWRRAQTDYRL